MQAMWRANQVLASGQAAQAAAIFAQLAQQLDIGVHPGPAQAARGRLPVRCPQCGAPVRSDEVEWIDNASAECVYCGSAVRTG